MSRSRKQRGWVDPAEVPVLPAPVVDNHTHLPVGEPSGPGSDNPLSAAELVARAGAVGVERVITSACELPDFEPTLQLVEELPQVRVALAVHPNEAVLHAGVREIGPDGLEMQLLEHHSVSLDEAVGRVESLARQNPERVVAIGETGVDLFRTGQRGREAQIESFRAHIALAKELDLPMQIHDRDAHEDCVRVLLADGAPQRTVFHCFSGGVELAQACAEHGWYASIAGQATYPANTELREGIAQLPTELLLVETDAPYLSPVPYRGRPNGSYLLPATVEFLARQRQLSAVEMCTQLLATTNTVYGTW